MDRRTRFLAVLVAVLAVTALLLALVPAAFAQQYISTKTIEAGQTWVVDDTTRLDVLIIKAGATVQAPEGKILTLTVNGVETGQALVTTKGMDTYLVPGSYRGTVVLTPAAPNLVPYAAPGPPGPPIMFPFRQALYIDAKGIDYARSVTAAWLGHDVGNEEANGLRLASTGENFTGVYVAGGTYVLKDLGVNFVGNGRSDFIGAGAAVVATGGSRLVVDGARIVNEGVARAAVVADGGANVLVKNSHLETHSGVLPADYIPTIDTSQMRSVPWMLGLSGNVRCTNLLGTNTVASYVNSYIASEGWGVLSTDGCTTPKLTAINDTIEILGEDGYGSYGIGDATEWFLGCTLNVGTYATISRGSFLHYGDSDKDTINKLNREYNIGLTAAEIEALPVKPTVVNSDRFGIMWHGGGTLDVTGGTVFNTKETTFLDKGQAITVTVDGSQGAKLLPGNGIILQLMDDDDPGPDFATMANSKTYVEPTGTPAKVADHNVSMADGSDARAVFSNIVLRGDFYNSTRGADAVPTVGAMADVATDGGSAPPDGGQAPGDGGGGPGGPGGPPPGMGGPSPINLSLTFDNATVTGLITASAATHAPGPTTITPDLYKYLGELSNTPAPVINNGVILHLRARSTWNITGTCYLSHLTLEKGSTIVAPTGHKVTMTVNGVYTPLLPGSYSGAITLTVAPKTRFGGTSLSALLMPVTE